MKDWIEAQARNLGFDAVGFADPHTLDFGRDLANYLIAGFHGDMGWMEERTAWRGSPARLWPECRSIIALAMCYGGPDGRAPRNHGEISAYARGKDYHDVIKKKLKILGRELIEREGGAIKVFVDTAPVMEKPIAAAAGIGWQGKHGNLLSRELGNWFFLGFVFTTLEIKADRRAEPHCGTCRSCLDACPTGAFDVNGRLDARRCISYLTIENKGTIPHDLREGIGNRIYGCDLCLDACPWNKFERGGHEALAARAGAVNPPLAELLALDDAEFRARFAGSPIKRIGWARMMRNCLIAVGNSGDANLAEAVRPFVASDDPILREAANWAMERL